MKIDLYLDGRSVEINDDIDFVLNKQFTQLTDLTAIIVDYSKTVKIPMTPHNNELFNYIYKIDHRVLLGINTVNYDPSQKIPMTMVYNGNLVMEGYAVLSSVDLKDKMYEINLYGQLGKLFSKMKELTIDKYNRESNGFWSSLTMDKDSMKSSFEAFNRTIDWDSENWTDFFGFTPQLYGKTDLIDGKSFECVDGTILKFEDIINERRNIDYADTYVDEGFDFNQYGELRSYLSRPYVYVSSLINLVKSQMDSLSDYELDLDEDWFNDGNPYYTHLCYFPGNEPIIDKGDSLSGMVTWVNSERDVNFPMNFLPTTASSSMDDYRYTTDGTLVTVTKSDGSVPDVGITLNFDGVYLRQKLEGTLTSSVTRKDPFFVYVTSDETIPVMWYGIYDQNNNLLTKIYLIEDEVKITTGPGPTYYSTVGVTKSNLWSKIKSQDPLAFVPTSVGISNNIVESSSSAEQIRVFYFGKVVVNTNKFRMRVGCDMINTETGAVARANISKSEAPWISVYCTTYQTRGNAKYQDRWFESISTRTWKFTTPSGLEISPNTYRSGTKWSILDILGNDFNPFEWFIEYCKMYRLHFDIDYATKKITLTSRYFNTITQKKMTVDYSKGVTIEPIIDQHSDIMFDYAENKSTKATKYLTNHQVSYGDQKIVTGMQIVDETMSLTPNKDLAVFVPQVPKALNWPNLSAYWPNTVQTVPSISYSNIIQTTKIIDTRDKDGKCQYFPFYCFRVQNLNRGVGNYFYGITDDTPTMKREGNYTLLDARTKAASGMTSDWYTLGYALRMNTIPQFDNYITMAVDVNSVVNPNNSPAVLPGSTTEELEVTPTYVNMSIEVPTLKKYTYVHPLTGKVTTVTTNYDGVTNTTTNDLSGSSSGSGSSSPTTTQTFIFWSTFAVPTEVYNGEIPSNIQSYSIQNRWQKWINELFNVNNKKVTCYVLMSYPEFINFRFNQLFVIENNLFLVNKIVDFNPNSNEPTKVELFQITDVDNLK